MFDGRVRQRLCERGQCDAACLSGARALATGCGDEQSRAALHDHEHGGDAGGDELHDQLTNGILTVNGALLGVSANNTNRAYGATNPVFTVSYSGFVNGDRPNVLSGPPVLTTSAVTNSPVGSYVITERFGDAGGDELRGESDERVADGQPGGVDAEGEQHERVRGDHRCLRGDYERVGERGQCEQRELSSAGALTGAGVAKSRAAS